MKAKRMAAARKRRKAGTTRPSLAYRLGVKAGYKDGYNAGYNYGFEAGVNAHQKPFEGTSIVIPTYNQRELLEQCIESIMDFTPEPHEIIVIDNGSTDGTAAYLESLTGRVRYRINPANTGFAGGVNQGMKMAMGTTLLMLNNDTVVTKGWLGNMLNCLHSDERIGLVGPMTNYISGDQLVATSYSFIGEMHRFAEKFNRPNPSSWLRTERLTGFCLLMRRELFERLGFLDEGFEIGNCEDDDLCLRVRLLGSQLVIAGDTFIHHVGSASMKALGSEMGEVYGSNIEFYGKKWGHVPEIHAEAKTIPVERRAMHHFYPNGIIVRGVQGVPYWLQNGSRRPIEAAERLPPATRLSHVELRCCPPGEPIHAEEAVRQLAGAEGDGAFPEGSMLQAEDGRLYRCEQGRRRRLVSPFAAAAWGLDRVPVRPVDGAALAQLPEGLPIVPPITIKAENL